MPLFKYKESVFNSLEEVMAVLKIDGIVEEMDDWQIPKLSSFKEYNAAEFLRMAEKYRNEMPPDLIQSSEKLWLAVVYTVKLFFLNLNVHLASHRSLSFFYDMAADKVSVASTARRLDRAWSLAEKLHSFTYGTPAFTEEEFPKLYSEIEFFVEEFPKITGLQSEFNALITEISEKKRKDIEYCVFNDKVKPEMGKKQFSPEHKFF